MLYIPPVGMLLVVIGVDVGVGFGIIIFADDETAAFVVGGGFSIS